MKTKTNIQAYAITSDDGKPNCPYEVLQLTLMDLMYIIIQS